tara:strand:+ start:570 stop:707 length:138 start_codon:yes stop_codon:yes gene_type:complete
MQHWKFARKLEVLHTVSSGIMYDYHSGLKVRVIPLLSEKHRTQIK